MVTALVLSRGGARAAYQVGVLRALVRMRRATLGPLARQHNPFCVICCTFAGAINAAALACRADRFEAVVEVVARLWEKLHAAQVYLGNAITLKDGVLEQRNFGDHAVPRIGQMPQISVHTVPGADPPTGRREPGLSPLVRAFGNAIARLTGKPLRQLPFQLA